MRLNLIWQTPHIFIVVFCLFSCEHSKIVAWRHKTLPCVYLGKSCWACILPRSSTLPPWVPTWGLSCHGWPKRRYECVSAHSSEHPPFTHFTFTPLGTQLPANSAVTFVLSRQSSYVCHLCVSCRMIAQCTFNQHLLLWNKPTGRIRVTAERSQLGMRV